METLWVIDSARGGGEGGGKRTQQTRTHNTKQKASSILHHRHHCSSHSPKCHEYVGMYSTLYSRFSIPVTLHSLSTRESCRVIHTAILPCPAIVFPSLAQSVEVREPRVRLSVTTPGVCPRHVILLYMIYMYVILLWELADSDAGYSKPGKRQIR